jgi:hypothetical protein
MLAKRKPFSGFEPVFSQSAHENTTGSIKRGKMAIAPLVFRYAQMKLLELHDTIC